MGTIRQRGKGSARGDHAQGGPGVWTFSTRQQAVDWLSEREDGVMAQVGDSSKRSVVAVIDRYEDHLSLMGRDAEAFRLRRFRTYKWAQQPVRTLTAEMLSGWRNERLKVVKPGTVLREMTLLRGVLEHARRDLGWIDVNPLRDVKRPPAPPDRRRLITDAERDAILSALDYTGSVETIGHETAVAFLLGMETAMRAGEIVGLEWHRVHLADRVIRLLKTKNGDQRQVPMSRRAVELLETLRGKSLIRVRRRVDPKRVFHIDSEVLDVTFRRAKRVAGIEDLHFHDTRATALTRLSAKLSPLELARMVGHRDLSSLMFYYAESATSLAAKLDADPASPK